ncbi:hypothetical protein BDAP_000038 [Binucleata daphniae]
MTQKLLKIQNHTAETSHSYVVEISENEYIKDLKNKTNSICITTEDFFILKDEYVIYDVLRITNVIHTFDNTFIGKYKNEFEFGVGVYKHTMIQKSKKLLHENLIIESMANVVKSEHKITKKTSKKEKDKNKRNVKEYERKTKQKKNERKINKNDCKVEKDIKISTFDYENRSEQINNAEKQKEDINNNKIDACVEQQKRIDTNEITIESRNTNQHHEKTNLDDNRNKTNTTITQNTIDQCNTKDIQTQNKNIKENEDVNHLKQSKKHNLDNSIDEAQSSENKENILNVAKNIKKFRLPKIREKIKKQEENTAVKPLKQKKKECDDFF